MTQLAGYDTITQNAITKVELGIRFVPNYEVAIYLRCFLKQLPNIFYHLQQIQPINKQDAFYCYHPFGLFNNYFASKNRVKISLYSVSHLLFKRVLLYLVINWPQISTPKLRNPWFYWVYLSNDFIVGKIVTPILFPYKTLHSFISSGFQHIPNCISCYKAL